MSIKNITNLYNLIDLSIGSINPPLETYSRVTDALISLANAVADYDGDIDDEEIWYIGEHGYMGGLDNLIVGAYWHYTDWHGGQWSRGYAALCALGRVFSPNMSTLEEDSAEFMTYQALETLGKEAANE